MALLYRAIWQDDRPELLAEARSEVALWLKGKTQGALSVPHSGSVTAGDDEVSIVESSGDDGAILLVRYDEEQGPDRWTTTLRALAGSTGEQWLWVDVERVSQNPFSTQAIAAPRFVRSLLESGTRPRRGSVSLSTRPRAFRPDEVAHLAYVICDDERDIPVVVFSHDAAVDDEVWTDRVLGAAEVLAGIASVCMLPPPAVDAFTDLVGRDLGVWGGALRVYLPGVTLDDPRPWRHRYLAAPRHLGSRLRAGSVVSAMLSSYVASRRPPELYATLRPLLRTSGPSVGEDADLLQLAEEELERVEGENATLIRRTHELEDQYLDMVGELEVLQRENNRLSAMFAMTSAHERGEAAPVDAVVPDGADDCRAAAELARKHLDRLSIAEGACRDLEKLDSQVNSGAWAATAWRGFRALQAYAEGAADFNGGFREWCERSGHTWSWPYNSKKLAMSESESVMKSPKLRSQRELPVDEALDPSGTRLMEAHLKIAEGGGDLAPRVYFYDDTKGSTGKLHIGFFGPNYLVRNTMT